MSACGTGGPGKGLQRRGPFAHARLLICRFGGRGPVYRIEVLLAVCYASAIVYLCARAVNPTWKPSWLGWFGEPGAHAMVTIAVILAFPSLHFVVRWLTRGKQTTATSLLLAGTAASALVLGMSAYWRCHGSQAPFFAPVTWTLALFAAEVQDAFGPTKVLACQTVPVALDLARLLAIVTTLGTALTAALALFRSERDRIAIWRARALTVVVGLDDDTVSMIRAIARSISPGEKLAVLSRNANSNAARLVHDLGAKIRVVNIDEPETMSTLRLWNRLHRLYLLSPDPVQNLQRFRVVDSQIGKYRGQRVPMPVTVRIDNPWQAEVLRRSFLTSTDRRWAGDAVGRYEVTAAKLVRHITMKRADTAESDSPATVVLCGLYPLTYAMASALAQLGREQELYERPHVVLPASVIIFAPGAQSFVDDHVMRQRTMAPTRAALPVIAFDDAPTVDAITEYLRQEPARHAVVFGDPSMETEGTRLASRFPELPVYVASAVSTALVDYSLVGHLYGFPINMELDEDAPQDVWERAAELIHGHYSRGRIELDPPRDPGRNLSRSSSIPTCAKCLTHCGWWRRSPAIAGTASKAGQRSLFRAASTKWTRCSSLTFSALMKRSSRGWSRPNTRTGMGPTKTRDGSMQRSATMSTSATTSSYRGMNSRSILVSCTMLDAALPAL